MSPDIEWLIGALIVMALGTYMMTWGYYRRYESVPTFLRQDPFPASSSERLFAPIAIAFGIVLVVLSFPMLLRGVAGPSTTHVDWVATPPPHTDYLLLPITSPGPPGDSRAPMAVQEWFVLADGDTQFILHLEGSEEYVRDAARAFSRYGRQVVHSRPTMRAMLDSAGWLSGYYNLGAPWVGSHAGLVIAFPCAPSEMMDTRPNRPAVGIWRSLSTGEWDTVVVGSLASDVPYYRDLRPR